MVFLKNTSVFKLYCWNITVRKLLRNTSTRYHPITTLNLNLNLILFISHNAEFLDSYSTHILPYTIWQSSTYFWFLCTPLTCNYKCLLQWNISSVCLLQLTRSHPYLLPLVLCISYGTLQNVFIKFSIDVCKKWIKFGYLEALWVMLSIWPRFGDLSLVALWPWPSPRGLILYITIRYSF